MSVINLRDENLMLWNNFRQGDADAFTQLMHLHYQDLFNYATRFTTNTGLVKDCLQDLFLLLWKNRLTISETVFVKYYLLKSLRRLLFKSKNSIKNFCFYNEVYYAESGTGISLPVDRIIVDHEETIELSKKIKKIITRLSKREQEVIYLRFYVDADVEEIAEIMSLNRQSVYNLLHEALKKIKKMLPSRAFLYNEGTAFLTTVLLFEKILSQNP